MSGKLIKKVTAAALALAMVGTALPQGSGFAGLFCGSDITASADEEGDFSYTIIDETEKTCKITRYYGQDAELEVPETLNGFTVTRIEENAFSSRNSLKHITLPETLKSIGSCAFSPCESLEEIILPDSVTSIDYSAFDQCHRLKSIKFSSNLHELKSDTFNNTGVTNLTIPGNIMQIGGERVFANCANLKTLVVEGSPYIGLDAFRYCQALETVVLEPGVATIGEAAFQCCINLKTVTIPKSVHNIYKNAFDQTGDDLTIIYDGTQEEWETITGSDTLPENVKIAFSSETGIRLYGHSLSLLEDNNIGVNFYMQLPESLSENAKMHFTIPTGNTVVEQDILVSEAGEKVVDNVTYKVFKCSVAAKEMTSDITAQILDAQNDIVGPVYVYSVKEYADYLLGHQSVDEYKAAAPLVKAMLNYGAYSQIYFDKNTADLANTGLTEAEKNVSGVTAGDINKPYSDKNMIVTEGFTETKFEKVALSLKSQTELVMYFTNPEYDLTFECKEGNAVEKTTTKDGYQVARIKGIRADLLGETYTLNLYDGEQILETVEYCPLTYCYYVILEGRGSEALQNVCKALFLYYQAAVDYFKV